MSGFDDVYIATLFWGLAAGSGMAGLLLFFTSIDSALRLCVISALSATLGAILFAAVFWPSASERQLANELAAGQDIGELLPAGDPIPVHAQDCVYLGRNDDRASVFIILLGNVITAVTPGPQWVITLNDQVIFRAAFRANQLFISTAIYDANGDIIADINDNIWRVAKYAPWYSRPDAHTLQVDDRHGLPTLYVRFMAQNAVQIMGDFRVQDQVLGIDERRLVLNTETVADGLGGFCLTGSGGTVRIGENIRLRVMSE